MLPVVTKFSQLRTPVRVPHDWKTAAPTFVADPPASASEATPSVQSERLTRRELGITWPVFLWTVGASLVLFRYAAGLVSLQRAQSSSTILRIKDGIEIRTSTRNSVRTAMTWGMRNPVILLPADSANWSSERLEMVLAHEFAHLRRRDYASQILAEIACALYWFHPLVWFATRTLREDAEQAADDAVISQGIKPTDYAEELLQMAVGLNRKDRPLARAGIAHMNQPQIETRLKAILANNNRRRGLTGLSVIGLVGIVGGAMIGVASLKLQDNDKDPKVLQTRALSNVKELATASLMYSQDYDDLYPHVTSTKDAKVVLSPYVKDENVFKSPREGAALNYNLNIGGSAAKWIEELWLVPVWYETTPKGINPAVGYADGHAKIVTPDKMPELTKALKIVHPRDRKSKPIGIGQIPPAP